MKIIEILSRAIRFLWERPFNTFFPIEAARKKGVKIGAGCRLIEVNFGSEPYLITLGDHVSATRVTFITHDGAVWCFRDQFPDADLISPIKVGNNVFLGYGVIVLPGVTIGDNVIVGAGSVVTRDIPSNCVAVGCPARPIKTLQEYWESKQDKIVRTKGLSPKAKKEYLLRLFSGSV
jgi:acetyltransferase-like isoleucine patch superfamily enzyme